MICSTPVIIVPPIGDILLAADDIGLTGLWFEGQKYFALYLDKEHEEKEVALFEKVKQWLDIYFSGERAGLYCTASFHRHRLSE